MLECRLICEKGRNIVMMQLNNSMRNIIIIIINAAPPRGIGV